MIGSTYVDEHRICGRKRRTSVIPASGGCQVIVEEQGETLTVFVPSL